MNTLIQSNVFATWLSRLHDAKGKARILARIDVAELAISAIPHRSVQGFSKRGFILDPAIESITHDAAHLFICC